jgi:hypothetical protein
MKKKIIFCCAVLVAAALPSLSQVKVRKATKQKIVTEGGGHFMRYSIEWKDTKNNAVEIDSVKAVAGDAPILFHAEPKRIWFEEVLLPPAKCQACVETSPVQQNLTRGIIFYYKQRGKNYAGKVEKFRQVTDSMRP